MRDMYGKVFDQSRTKSSSCKVGKRFELTSEMHIHILLHIQGQFRVTDHVFGLWKEAQGAGNTHMDTDRTCDTTQKTVKQECRVSSFKCDCRMNAD